MADRDADDGRADGDRRSAARRWPRPPTTPPRPRRPRPPRRRDGDRGRAEADDAPPRPAAEAPEAAAEPTSRGRRRRPRRGRGRGAPTTAAEAEPRDRRSRAAEPAAAERPSRRPPPQRAGARRVRAASACATRREVVPALVKQFEYANPNQVPRLEKIVVNIGLGEALTNAKAIDAASGDLTMITGQKPIVMKARRSIAQFKIRTGNPIGLKVTLRGQRMWDFLERLTLLALPRIRDFRGTPEPVVRRPRQLHPRAARADRVPRDRLRQGGPSPRAGGQHRDDGEVRRGVEASARAPRHALRLVGGEGRPWPRNR